MDMSTPQTDKYGTCRWYNSEGLLHREQGPAVERDDGYREWYLNGLLHREDGPAIEWNDGTRMWFLNDEWLTFEEWLDKTNTSLQYLTLLRLRWT
jgi:hypothetical protein